MLIWCKKTAEVQFLQILALGPGYVDANTVSFNIWAFQTVIFSSVVLA